MWITRDRQELITPSKQRARTELFWRKRGWFISTENFCLKYSVFERELSWFVSGWRSGSYGCVRIGWSQEYLPVKPCQFHSSQSKSAYKDIIVSAFMHDIWPEWLAVPALWWRYSLELSSSWCSWLLWSSCFDIFHSSTLEKFSTHFSILSRLIYHQPKWYHFSCEKNTFSCFFIYLWA